MKKKNKRKEFILIQKAYIYRRDKGKCYFYKQKTKDDRGHLICRDGKPIRWDEKLCFHHIKFCCHHGKNEINNGAPAHKTCHNTFHHPKNNKDKWEV